MFSQQPTRNKNKPTHTSPHIRTYNINTTQPLVCNRQHYFPPLTLWCRHRRPTSLPPNIGNQPQRWWWAYWVTSSIGIDSKKTSSLADNDTCHHRRNAVTAYWRISWSTVSLSIDNINEDEPSVVTSLLCRNLYSIAISPRNELSPNLWSCFYAYHLPPPPPS